MEPIDAAYETFCKFADQVVPTYWETICTEADARMKLIDPIFTDVLGWPAREIHLEDHASKGRIDYRLTVRGLNRLIVEGKKEGRDLGVSDDYAGRSFKLNGSVFNTEAAREGIDQAIYYCAQKGAELACVTNGRQWVVFRGNRGADGTDTRDGKACVFGSLAAVKEKFKKFYDLLSFEAVADYRFRALFQEEEGQPIRSKAFRAVVRTRDSRQFLIASKLSADIDRIMLPFFQDLSGEGEAEARRVCFVTTSESDTAETGIARISEELRDQVRAIETEDPAQFSETIKRVKEMNRHELILLVGTKGAGKSTFMERLFADVLDRKIAENCVLIRIDLADCGCDASTIINWLDENFLRVAEAAIFPDGPPTYEELVGMYWWEYKLWRDGHAKPLYETNPTQFKIDFGRHIAARRDGNPNEYITHMIARIVKGLKKVPCLVFDNADHFDVPFQEEVFKYAHALYRKSICLVLVPITDTTSWQLARQGPMQSFFTESFYLPTPSTDLILRKRIEYLQSRINEQDPVKGRNYFTSRGIRIDIDNIKAFAACL
jgi:predicted type IV restriction endonuclease/GTPase SAR1 family protein